MIAAIYARKSTEQRSTDDEAKSVAQQILNARAFAAEKGWTVADGHVYADDAVSGADTRKLKARRRLLDVIAAGAPFQVLIVREESRFSRRDGDEAFGELKQIVRAGVDVWFYKARSRFAFGTFGENIVGFVKAEAAADYRRQIASWTYDAMARKARAGHVTGGRCFGYDQVRVDGHVERRINESAAAVVREIFQRAAAGEGLRTIAKALNVLNAPSPRAQRGRPGGWAPSSVREVLHRDTYRGLLTWNRTKKRDADGQQRRHDRPRDEWMTVPAEHLRLVPEVLWQSVHHRLQQRQSAAVLAPPLISGRGIRQRYFLTGFGRCACCGGSMQAVSRASSAGRIVRYVCGTYWNRGTTVCSNGLMIDMERTDRAVRELLTTEVLRPRIIDHALELFVAARQRDNDSGDGGARGRLEHQLKDLDAELANLADTAARGGAVPAILAALAGRDAERRRVGAALAVLTRSAIRKPLPRADMRARLGAFLKDWHTGLLAKSSTAARGVLDAVLADRIQFAPDGQYRRYALTIPITFDRVLSCVLPELPGLQEMMASPTGFEPVF